MGYFIKNSACLKKIILDGITTISTDLRRMVAMAPEMILQSSKEHLEVPFYLMLRASL